ncbi:arabinan endo-1,5-alpha-L-arabinosidase [Bacillus sp. B1-b2]|uniref:arabinan endo-1,5-alpha-L-arabinosidase n=1 Tax=Bacillus sp. B1-b2 TaxID=2653201 RepID=UPI0012627A9D|nr:arabinan endo-1,5-alpha-L-arabinosidase [Bacillus sp. B1-b2]KAB7666316.1 arabinan endo-1,5-alpha-L-arabinosidase [Bacillus sp. B1-b2]
MEIKEETRRGLGLVESYCWGTIGTHDPTIIKENDYYYMFSTDTHANSKPTQGAQIRKSKDLIHWEFVGTALNDVPELAKNWSNASGLWAPEVIKYEDTFYMYYSASTFGSTVSCIGLATANHPEGPWTDQGIVIKTNPEIATHNAIDANVIIDKDGQYWLCYGSFFGGIHLVRLNMETGMPVEEEGYGTLLAKRPQEVEGAIEGAFILYHPEFDYYYLFTSYDSLNDSYNIRVARSKDITGPYVDMNGRNMIDTDDSPHSIGIKLAGSYQFNDDIAWIGPGHNSIYTEKNKQWMVHHVRIEAFSPYHYGFIRELFWLKNGWPVVSPEHYENIDAQSYSIKDLQGNWECIVFDEDTTVKKSNLVTVEESELLEIDSLGDNQFIFSKRDLEFTIFPVKDWKKDTVTIGFSGLTRKGKAIFGKRV